MDQENTISNIYTKKFYEVQKHLTLSNHGYLGYLVVMSKKFWNSLPDDLKSAVIQAMKDAMPKREFGQQSLITLNLKRLKIMPKRR